MRQREVGGMRAMESLVKKALSDAFIALCETKPISHISIQNVVDKCGISRQTFYRYFSDKYDLMNYLYMLELDYTVTLYEKCEDGLRCMFLHLFEHFREHKKYYMMVCREEAQNGLIESIYRINKEACIAKYHEKYGSGSLAEHVKLMIDFKCIAEAELIKNWINSGMKTEPSVITEAILDSIAPMLRDLFNDPQMTAASNIQ
jgi:AcrR family transcriptional regulator